MDMFWTHNKGNSVAVERFIRSRKNKIYKYMTSISKNLYIDKLNDTVNKYNNAYHRTIEMKPVKRKIRNLKLVTMYKYQIIKTFLRKVTLKIGLKNFCG